MKQHILLLALCGNFLLGFSGNKNDDLLVHISFDNSTRINEVNSNTITVLGRIGKDTLDKFGTSSNAVSLTTPEGGISIDPVITTNGTWSINFWHKIIVASNDWLADYQGIVMGNEQVPNRPEWHTANAYGAFLNLNGKYAMQDGIYDGSSWGDASSLKSFSIGPNVGVWSMTTIVVDGTKARLYVDGIKKDSLTITSYNLDATSLLSAGYGDFDEYRVYDVAIDQSIINDLYNETSVITASHQREANVNVSPNPTSGTLFLEGVTKAELLSTSGSVLQTVNITEEGEMNVEQKAGIYFLRMKTTAGDIQVQKIIVQ